MGTNPLDFEDDFWKDMEDVVFINVRKDKTINMQTSVKNMEELKSIFSTALGLWECQTKKFKHKLHKKIIFCIWKKTRENFKKKIWKN